MNLLGYDYSGYGCSSGQPTVLNALADIEACYDWLRSRGQQPQEIVAYGQSVSVSFRGCQGVPKGATTFTSACCPLKVSLCSDASQHVLSDAGGLRAKLPPGSQGAQIRRSGAAQPPGIRCAAPRMLLCCEPEGLPWP